MDLPMAAADALFLWAETPTRPLHVGALAVLSQPDNGTGRYLRKVFSAAVARQQVARGGADARTGRSPRSGSGLGAPRPRWTWITTCGLAHCRHGPVPPSCGRWFLNYTPACWTAPARYGRWT